MVSTETNSKILKKSLNSINAVQALSRWGTGPSSPANTCKWIVGRLRQAWLGLGEGGLGGASCQNSGFTSTRKEGERLVLWQATFKCKLSFWTSNVKLLRTFCFWGGRSQNWKLFADLRVLHCCNDDILLTSTFNPVNAQVYNLISRVGRICKICHLCDSSRGQWVV